MMRAKTFRFATSQITSADLALGVFGWGLAVASASFGIYMAMRVPDHSPSAEFPIFARLAPRPADAARPHVPSKATDDLDLAATASISPAPPGAATRTPQDAAATGPIVPGIVLEGAGTDAAEVAIDGRMRKVRVGDMIPGAGEVLAIYPGARPMVRTSRGLIVATGD